MKKKSLIAILTVLMITSMLNIQETQAEETTETEHQQQILLEEALDESDIEKLEELKAIQEEEKEEIEIIIPELEDNELSEETKEAIEENEAEEEVMTRSIMPFSMPETQSLTRKTVKEGIAHFNNKSGATYNIYDESKKGTKISYISPVRSYTPDAAVLDHKDNRYRIVVAGVEGWISDEALTVVPVNEVKSVSHYSVDNVGDLVHYLTKNVNSQSYNPINNGPAPSYLKKGVKYYSYDGHFFYTKIETMMSDYKAGHRNNAVNKNTPFFNYFQFLPYRSKSSITKNDLDAYLRRYGYTQHVADGHKESSTANVPSNQSKLVGQTQHFINQMNKYGANGMITFSLSVHETGWGRSYFARSRNNMFGHSVFDSDTKKANYYESVEKSIWNHNANFLNGDYLKSTGTNYRGSMLGNKASGLNVQYASDPYWGEKIAEHYYQLDGFTNNKDFNKYKLGYKNDGDVVNLRKGPSTSTDRVATARYKYQTFIIYDAVKGQKINGNDIWYKISSDDILDKNGNRISNPGSETGYRLDDSFVYIHSDYLTPVGEIPKPKPDSKPKPKPVIKGDVNGDGKITLIDLAMVKSHLLKNRKLSKDEFARADINGDQKITLLDLASIKSHLLGNSSLY